MGSTRFIIWHELKKDRGPIIFLCFFFLLFGPIGQISTYYQDSKPGFHFWRGPSGEVLSGYQLGNQEIIEHPFNEVAHDNLLTRYELDKLDRVTMVNVTWSNRNMNYVISSSEDGINYSILKSDINYNENEIYIFEPVNAKFIQFTTSNEISELYIINMKDTYWWILEWLPQTASAPMFAFCIWFMVIMYRFMFKREYIRKLAKLYRAKQEVKSL